MTRINALRNIAGPRDFIAWGKNIGGNISAFVFAAVLIVCSVTIGCSSSNDNDKPKLLGSNNQIPAPQVQSSVASTSAPVMQAETKPAPKKIVHKKPATVNYTDKAYGLTFEYSRRYAIETGNAAADVVASSPMPMNFVAPGGIALAAVELPQTGFANTDFSSAFFDVSVHKNLTADQCNEFAVPQPKVAATPEAPAAAIAGASPAPASKAAPAPAGETAAVSAAPTASSEAQPAAAQPAAAATISTEPAKPSDATTPNAQSDATSGSKLLVGDLELRGTEAVSGEGTRQSDSKYFHVYQNGTCYEFALNVSTVASEEGMTKHVDRDKVFSSLEKILGTVKINPVAPEATAETPATPAAAETPAQ